MRRTAIALGVIFIAFAAVVAALIACRIRLTAAALRYGHAGGVRHLLGREQLVRGRIRERRDRRAIDRD